MSDELARIAIQSHFPVASLTIPLEHIQKYGRDESLLLAGVLLLNEKVSNWFDVDFLRIEEITHFNQKRQCALLKELMAHEVLEYRVKSSSVSLRVNLLEIHRTRLNSPPSPKYIPGDLRKEYDSLIGA